MSRDPGSYDAPATSAIPRKCGRVLLHGDAKTLLYIGWGERVGIGGDVWIRFAIARDWHEAW